MLILEMNYRGRGHGYKKKMIETWLFFREGMSPVWYHPGLEWEAHGWVFGYLVWDSRQSNSLHESSRLLPEEQ